MISYLKSCLYTYFVSPSLLMICAVIAVSIKCLHSVSLMAGSCCPVPPGNSHLTERCLPFEPKNSILSGGLNPPNVRRLFSHASPLSSLLSPLSSLLLPPLLYIVLAFVFVSVLEVSIQFVFNFLSVATCTCNFRWPVLLLLLASSTSLQLPCPGWLLKAFTSISVFPVFSRENQK